jgi:uncharacterized repeat protein (TIGR01451 family)
MILLYPGLAFGLNPGAVSITMVTAPFFNNDSNKPCPPDNEGPHGAYVGFEMCNTSGAVLTGLEAEVTQFTGTGFGLAGGQLSKLYIGNLDPGKCDIGYWFVEYPCLHNIPTTITVVVNDLNPGTVSGTGMVTTRSSLSTSSTAEVDSTSLGAGSVIGQIVSYDVVYEFGSLKAGDNFSLQPVGNLDFDAGCFQLINAQILASLVPGITVGDQDKLYFTATANKGGTRNRVKIRYYYITQCTGVSTSADPYAGHDGGTTLKYTGNYADPNNTVTFNTVSSSLDIKKTVNDPSPEPGDTIQYVVTVLNNSSFAISFDRIIDSLPAGFMFYKTDPTGDITDANSGELPSQGDLGVIRWRGGIPSPVFPFDEYYMAANDSLVLRYEVILPPGIRGEYTNEARAGIGSYETDPPAVARVCVSCNPPVAIDDINFTLTGLQVSGLVLTNDRDMDGDNLTVTSTPVSGTMNGTLILEPDGSYTYTPNVGFTGEDSFSYQVCDDLPSPGGPLCDTATVTLYVTIPTQLNDPPIAVHDAHLTLVNTPITGVSLLTNDWEPDYDLLSIKTVPIGPVSNGTVTLNPDGTFVFTPDMGFTGEGSFSYEICDNALPPLCDTARVTITVIADEDLLLNDPPFAGDDFVFTPQDLPVGGSLLPNDSDPNGDNLVVNTSPVAGPSAGILSINPDGTFVYTPNTGFSGTDQFIYEICDNQVPALCVLGTAYILVVPGSIFPVEWLMFEAVLERQDGMIRWATAVEQGTDFYMVQRSYDGRLFGNRGRVEAAGTSQSVRSYQFIDKEVVGAGFANVYYRLKQVDLDGAFSYSDVVELQVPEAPAMEAKVYPNPATDMVIIELRHHTGEYIHFDLFDARGAKVFSSGLEGADHGVQRISIPLEGLSPGIYMYHIKTDGHRLGGRIVKKPQ